MTRRRGLLFDMDGVVCHNMPAHTEAWRLFLRKHDIAIETRDFLANTMGMPTRDVLAYYFKRRVTRAEEVEFDEAKEALYRKIYLPNRRAAPGLRALLTKAHAAGFRLGLGTGSKTDNVSFILDGLRLRRYFETVVGAGDVKKGKPDPETFLTLAERLKVRPRECLVFEDSLLGEQAARRAGMKFVAVTTSHKASEFKTAVLAVRDFRGLSTAKIAALLLSAAFLLCSCGKRPEPVEAPARSVVASTPAQADETPEPLFRLDSNEPEIPAAPDHAQAHPGPDDALKADRAGLTVGTFTERIAIDWRSEPAPDGRKRLWAKLAVVTYRMTIAIFVSSNYKEGTCPYIVTWEHELSHANAYVSMFAAAKVHMLGALEHSQEIEPPLPSREAPALVKDDEVEDFERRLGDKLRLVVEDQGRVMNAMMADHKRDRDSPEAYRRDFDRCPAADWAAGGGGS